MAASRILSIAFLLVALTPLQAQDPYRVEKVTVTGTRRVSFQSGSGQPTSSVALGQLVEIVVEDPSARQPVAPVLDVKLAAADGIDGPLIVYAKRDNALTAPVTYRTDPISIGGVPGDQRQLLLPFGVGNFTPGLAAVPGTIRNFDLANGGSIVATVNFSSEVAGGILQVFDTSTDRSLGLCYDAMFGWRDLLRPQLPNSEILRTFLGDGIRAAAVEPRPIERAAILNKHLVSLSVAYKSGAVDDLKPQGQPTLDCDARLRELFDWFQQSSPGVLSDVAIPGGTTLIKAPLTNPHVDEYTYGMSKRLGSRGLNRADLLATAESVAHDPHLARRELYSGDGVGRRPLTNEEYYFACNYAGEPTSTTSNPGLPRYFEVVNGCWKFLESTDKASTGSSAVTSNDPGGPNVRTFDITGPVQAVSPTAVTIKGLTFQIAPGTPIPPELAVGATVRVTGELDANNRIAVIAVGENPYGTTSRSRQSLWRRPLVIAVGENPYGTTWKPIRDIRFRGNYSTFLDERVSRGLDERASGGDWVFNTSYGDYVQRLANTPADTTFIAGYETLLGELQTSSILNGSEYQPGQFLAARWRMHTPIFTGVARPPDHAGRAHLSTAPALFRPPFASALSSRSPGPDARVRRVSSSIAHDLWIPPAQPRTSSSARDGGPNVKLFFTSLGRSSGEAVRMTLVNTGDRPVRLRGEVLALRPLARATQADIARELKALAGFPSATLTMDAYCLNFAKEPPREGMVFALADAKAQLALGPTHRILDVVDRLHATSQLKPDSDPDEYRHALIQWSVWTVEQKFDERGYTRAFVGHARKNVEAGGRRWTSEIEKAVAALAPNRWKAITAVLREASAVPFR